MEFAFIIWVLERIFMKINVCHLWGTACVVFFTSVYSNGHALHNGFMELHVAVYVFSDL
jgi:thiol:disulfide interchange protein